MNLLNIKITLIVGLVLFQLKHFSYARLNKKVLKQSQRALYYFLNKGIEKQKLFLSLLKIIIKLLKLPLEGGKLIIDSTTIDKSYSKDLEGASYVWDSRKGRSVYGYSIVYLIWVINGFHIPILFKTYVPGEIIPKKVTKKGNPKRMRAKKTHNELACELLSFARNQLKIKPESVHFDEAFTCQRLLKLLKGYNWVGVFALRSNVKFEGEKLLFRKWKNEPEWGKLSSGIKISLMKDNKNFYGTTKYGVSRWWLKKEWDKRWDIELDFRFLKSEVYWESCQSISKRVQENHWTLGLLAFLVIQLLSNELNLNWYETKEEAELHRPRLMKIASTLINTVL